MSQEEDWLKRQLNEVVQDISKAEQECRDELHRTVPVLLDFNQQLIGGRYDLSIAHLLSSVGYAIEKGLVEVPVLRFERTMTDEQLRALAFRLTWADLESFLSQLGVSLWINLWKARQ